MVESSVGAYLVKISTFDEIVILWDSASILHSTKYVFARTLSLVPILTQIFFKEIDFYMIIQPRE